jgi:hypothetical protein
LPRTPEAGSPQLSSLSGKMHRHLGVCDVVDGDLR